MADVQAHAGPAPVERRLAAMERVVEARPHASGYDMEHGIADIEKLTPQAGARVVARAWTDPEFRTRLLEDGKSAVAEFGITMPAHHRQLVVLEDTKTLHNVIVCTLCSCTAMALIGPPPDWYKDLSYRARVVRESRTVLKEMGCDLPDEVEIQVWDTTADTRFMVLPVQPPHTLGWDEERLATIVTRDSLIGVQRL